MDAIVVTCGRGWSRLSFVVGLGLVVGVAVVVATVSVAGAAGKGGWLWYIKVMIRQGIFALSLQDLRPFPTHIAVSYEGHSGMVRAVAVEARWGPVGGRMDFGC